MKIFQNLLFVTYSSKKAFSKIALDLKLNKKKLNFITFGLETKFLFKFLINLNKKIKKSIM